MKLCFCDLLDRVWYFMKTREDNNVIDYTGQVYIEIETKLSRPIWPRVCDENHTRQQNDRSYRYSLRRKWNWVTVFDWTGCDLWQKPNNTMTWLIYKSGLRQNQNRIIGTYLIEYGMWWKPYRTTTRSIIQVRSTSKTILNVCDRSNLVPIMKKLDKTMMWLIV